MKIVVTMPVTPEQRAKIVACAPEAEFAFGREESLRDAEVILGNIPPARLAECEKLRFLQLNNAGSDEFKPGCLPPGAVMCNASGAYGLAISEHMLGGLMMLMKRFDQYRDNQKLHLWKDMGHVRSVYGSKALIVGFGDIGYEFGYRLHALGAEVHGLRRRPGGKPDWLAGMHGMDEMDAMLPEMDIVACCLPGTPETRNTFTRQRFRLMKQGAYFLNVGRGYCADTDALYDALTEGHLGGAVIDVTDPEPLPPDHPLWDAPNLALTPHVSGQYHLYETFLRILDIACDNLKRYMAGQPLRNVVNLATGYRDDARQYE